MFARPIDHELKFVLLQPQQAEEVFAVVDKNRQFLRTWLPWIDSNTNADDSKEFIKKTLQQVSDESGLQCGIFYQDRFVGMVGYHRIKRHADLGEIGYWLAEDANGRGIMTRCVKAMINIGIQEFGLKKIEIHCAEGNRRSRAIPERLGFTQEGVIRRAGNLYGECVNHVIYGLLAEEWKAE